MVRFTRRKGMWRPDTAGCSMRMSQVGWRPTTMTGLSSSTSVTMAPSRLTTTFWPTSLAPEARGRGAGRAQLVVHIFGSLDGARDQRRVARFLVAVDQSQ